MDTITNSSVAIKRKTTIEDLRFSLREGKHGLSAVPGLLRQTLREDMWRSFPVEIEGEWTDHTPDSFEDFVKREPPYGLGSTIDLLKRICRDDKDVLDMIDFAVQGTVGTPPSYEQDNLLPDKFLYNIQDYTRNNDNVAPTGTSESAGLRRLRKIAKDKDRPERAKKAEGLRRKIFNNEISVHAALIELNLRTPTFTIPVHTGRAARAIKKRFTPAQIQELIRLLQDD